MKNRTWFNGKLYLDTLRQLRVMGSAYLIACLAISYLPPLVMAMGEPWDALEMPVFVPILFLLMTVGAITMVYNAFSFLFRQNGSDVFHALPTKRTGVCLSRFLAVMTWLWGIIVITVLGTVFMYGFLCGQWYFSYIPWLCGYFGTISLFFAASALCASALTGTRFAALAVTGLVAFVARYLLLMLGMAILALAPVVSVSDFGLLLNPSANIATATLMQPTNLLDSLDYLNIPAMMTTLWPMAYTFLVGCAYAAAGVFLYHRRSSETAGKSAPNPVLQAVYRCGVTLPVLLSFVIALFVSTENVMSAMMDNMTIPIVALVLSLLVYLSFEVITQKRLRGLWKTLPSYAALLAFCVLFALSAKGMANHRMHILPEADEISGIAFEVDSNNYFNRAFDGQRIENERIHEIVSEALKNNVDTYDATGSVTDADSWRQMQVRIVRKSGPSMVRILTFDYEQEQEIRAALLQDEAFMQMIRQLPKADDLLSLSISQSELTDSKVRAVYEVLTGELETLSDEEYACVVNAPYIFSEKSDLLVVNMLTFSGQMDLQYYIGSIYITPLTPNALHQYVALKKEQSDGYLDAYLPKTPISEVSGEIKLALYDLEEGGNVTFTEETNAQPGEIRNVSEQMLAASNLVRQALDQPPSRYLVQVAMIVSTGIEPDEYEIQTGFVYLTAEQLQTLQTLFPSY